MKMSQRSRGSETGLAVIVMLMLLSIILGSIALGVRSLNQVDRELKLLEQRHLRRLASISVTNSTPTPARPNP